MAAFSGMPVNELDQPQYSFKQRLLLAILPRLGGALLRLWAASWRLRLECPREVDPRYAPEARIYAFWHEGVVTIIPHWRDCRIQGLASLSFDGELIARTMQFLGYPPPARGSSSKGGAQALEHQLKSLRDGYHVAITLDGPRGPAYEPKLGAVRLAARTGLAIIPVGSACSPDTRLRNWDRTQVPPPFGKVGFVFGDAIYAGELEESAAVERLRASLDVAVKRARVLVEA